MLTRLITISVLLVAVAVPASALDQNPKSLVIVDTGFDTELPIFHDRVLGEVCILDWSSCPNKGYFQEGPGAAYLPRAISSFNGFYHGTQMASIALAQDRGFKVVLIRIIAHSSTGNRLPAQDQTVAKVLEWVILNKDKFNVGAIAMAQGHAGNRLARDYCPKFENIDKKILELKRLDIPFVVPAGNDGNKFQINWPACIPSALAIGASNSEDQIASYSNIDRTLVDFYAPGKADSMLPSGKITPSIGTSVSTIIAASNWVSIANKNPSKTYSELVQYFRGGPIIFDEKFNYGRKMLFESFTQ